MHLSSVKSQPIPLIQNLIQTEGKTLVITIGIETKIRYILRKKKVNLKQEKKFIFPILLFIFRV